MFYHELKNVIEGVLIMDWLQFLEIVCIPAFCWLIYDLSAFKKEMADYKLKVAEDAKQYATNEAIIRMESKIDDLRSLIIEELRPKRAKK